jgi:periplasmic protein TonB
MQPPIATETPDPKFPKQARDAKFSGNVVVALVVGRDGKPCNVHLVRGVGMGLDESAVNVVQHYRFRPATLNGKPVAANLNVEVNFNYYSR